MTLIEFLEHEVDQRSRSGLPTYIEQAENALDEARDAECLLRKAMEILPDSLTRDEIFAYLVGR